MKMKSTQLGPVFVLLVSSSFLNDPCFSASPLTPTEVKQNERPLTLQETLERAYMQNAALDAARATLRATDETVSQANAAWRPSLSVTGNQTWNQTNSFDNIPNQRQAQTNYLAQIQQNVYQGGRTEATLGQAESSVLAGKAGLFTTEQQTLTNAVTAHASVISTEEKLKYLRQSEDFYRINLERVKAQFEVGEKTLTEVALIEAGYEDAKANVASAIANLESAIATYKNQVGTPPGKLAPADIIVEIPKEYDEVIETAKVKNPTIIQARYSLEAAQYNVQIQASQLLPTVGVNAGVGNNRNQNNVAINRNVQKNTQFQMGTTVTVPIYSQGIPNSQVRQAYQQVAQQKVQLVGTQRQVEQDARTAWEGLLAAREAVKSRLASVKAQQLAVEGIVEEAFVGTKTYVDVRELEQELITQQIALVDAQQNLITSTYAVLSSMGKLTARDLHLKVKYYDPDAYYREFRDAWIQFWEGQDRRYVRDGDVS